MAYEEHLANRIREYLVEADEFDVEEKGMFGGWAFLVNGKMCINVSGDRLMCRFDPALTEALSDRPGFLPMIMKGRQYKGYCYVDPIGYKNKSDFKFWLDLCLEFNAQAKSSKGKKRRK